MVFPFSVFFRNYSGVSEKFQAVFAVYPLFSFTVVFPGDPFAEAAPAFSGREDCRAFLSILCAFSINSFLIDSKELLDEEIHAIFHWRTGFPVLSGNRDGVLSMHAVAFSL